MRSEELLCRHKPGRRGLSEWRVKSGEWNYCAADAADLIQGSALGEVSVRISDLANTHSWLPFQGRLEICRLCRHRNSTLNSQLSTLNSIRRASGSFTPHSSLNKTPHPLRPIIQKLIFSPRCTLRIISCLALRLMPAAPLFITAPLPAAIADSFGRRVPASMRFVMLSSSSLA